MLRSIITRIGLIATLALAGFSTVGATEVVLTHQGRLLDASDQPVTGTVSLTFRIFEAPTGGMELWSETHPTVTVEQGLFIAQLGEIIPLPVDVITPASDSLTTRWLEIQVGGEILVPRQRLGTTPSAASSSRVSGDISTSPGALRIGGMSGSTTGTIRMATTTDSAGTTLEVDSDGNGIPEYAHFSFGSTPRSGSISVAIEGDARAGLRSIATPDSAESALDCDTDGDGIPESSVSSKTKGTKATSHLAGMSGSTTGTIRMAASPDSTGTTLDSDSDGDGLIDNSITQSSTYAGAGLDLRYRSGTRVFCGVADRTATGHLSGMSGSTTGTIRMAASPDSTESVLEQDSDGDGITESSISSKTKGTRATGGYVGGMSGSTTGTIRMAASPDSTNTALDSDTNGDGIPESSVKSKTSGPRATTSLSGMSGSTTGTIRMSAAPDSTMTVLGTDTNGDLVPENTIIHKSKETQAGSTYLGRGGSTTGTIRMQASGTGQGGGSSLVAAELDNDGDSDPDGGGSFEAKETRATLKTYFESGDIPTQDNLVQTTCDGSGVETALRSPTALLTWGTGLAFKVDATGPSITMDVDSVPTFTVHAGDGYLSSKLGIGMTPVEKIDVDGGAYCDGANWVNASDKNSKENFRSVDGEKLLRELSDLEITQWNYKGDDGTTHIGPTAQDFKKSFGLGKDDKSISTIDPSGVALAAIKALYELTQKQAAEIENLKSEMAKIRKSAR